VAVRDTLAPGDVADAIGEVEWRRLARQVIEVFREDQLLVSASAIAFRVLIATVVGALFVAGLVGFFGLTEIWRSDIAPDLRGSVSDPVYRMIDDAVVYVLENKSVFWVTLGAGIALWQISRVVRVSGQVLNRVYNIDDEDEGPVLAQLWTSLKAAAAIAVLIIAALAVVRLGPLALDDVIGDSTAAHVVGFIVRWSVAAVLLFLAVGLVVRAGPSIDRPLRWVSFGSGLTVAGWIVSSILFGFYLSLSHSFANVYGVLLSTFLLVEYLYFAAVVFLGGLVIDRLVEERSSAS
jgi:membrane protein